MTAAQPRQFIALWRAFSRQLFISETVASERQMQRAMVGVLAFLVTPGLLIPFQLAGAFEYAAIRFPALVEPLTRLMMTIFITYSMVSVGAIAAFVWDGLSFDRRDAMVLGPLPLGRATVVTAKLAAMATFLLVAAGSVNIITAVPFALIAGNHQGAADVGRLMAAHLTATIAAAAFVFCAFVVLRALLGIFGGGRVATASVLQFLLVSALLCFFAFVPTAIQILPARRVGRRVVEFGVHQAPIPAWSPTNWFLGLYDLVRGSATVDYHATAARAVVIPVIVLVAAIAMTVAGYRRQLRLSLTPTASVRTGGISTLQRALARLLVVGDSVAAATADFVLTTIARNRPQQSPIAINAALGVVIIVIAVANRAPGTAFLHSSFAAAGIPLLLAFWTAAGIRAAFYVPCELPAAWSFRLNAPSDTEAYAAGTRAAAFAFLAPPAALLAFGLMTIAAGWQHALGHALFVTACVAALAQFMVLTIDFVPFTEPYRAGHARLKTRWPLYLIGAFVFGFVLPRLELAISGAALSIAIACIVAGVFAAAVQSQRRARAWKFTPLDEFVDDDAILVLNIGLAPREVKLDANA